MSNSVRAGKIEEEKLKRFRLLQSFQKVLKQVSDRKGLDATWSDPKRKLQLCDYLSLYLFSLFNPVIDSMRGACAASQLSRVSKKVCSSSVSLGSFSEAQHLVDEELLHLVFDQLRNELPDQKNVRGLERLKAMNPKIVDSSVWRVYDRMSWALWRPVSGGRNTTSDSAIRAHVVFDLVKGVPEEAKVTSAKACERKIWKELAEPGNLYVGDRYYSYNYSLLGQMVDKGIHFLVRARIDSQWVVEKELPLTEEDQAEGVCCSAWVRLGKNGDGPRVRVVQVVGAEEAMLLLTSLPEKDLSAAEVRLLYKHRWQIEYFFYWLKCILGNRHWFCETSKGIQVQVYLALIAAVLLMLLTGKRPNKRSMEAIQFFTNGWATEEDLVEQLSRYA